MFEKMKTMFLELVKKIGLEVPADKSAVIDAAIQKIADDLDKNNDPDAVKKGFEELGLSLKDILKQTEKKEDPKPDPKPDPKATVNPELEEAIKTLTQKITDLEKSQTDIANTVLAEKVTIELNKAVRAGKISITAKEKYGKMLTENFESIKTVLDDMPDNVQIAKQNEDKPDTKEFDTKVKPILGGVDQKIMAKVNEDFKTK